MNILNWKELSFREDIVKIVTIQEFSVVIKKKIKKKIKKLSESIILARLFMFYKTTGGLLLLIDTQVSFFRNTFPVS
jgi:hypothetical protein